MTTRAYCIRAISTSRIPTVPSALEHLPPEKLADDILAKERRIIEIMEEIKAELAGARL